MVTLQGMLRIVCAPSIANVCRMSENIHIISSTYAGNSKTRSRFVYDEFSPVLEIAVKFALYVTNWQ